MSSSSSPSSSAHARLRLLPAERMLTSPLADLKRRSRLRRQQQQMEEEEDDSQPSTRFGLNDEHEQQYSVEEDEIDWSNKSPMHSSANRRHLNSHNPSTWRPYGSTVLLPQRQLYLNDDDQEDYDQDDIYDERCSNVLDGNFILRKTPRPHRVNDTRVYSSHPSSLSRSSGYLLGLPITSCSSALVAKRASLSYHHIKNEQHQHGATRAWDERARMSTSYSGSSSGCSTQSSASSSYGGTLLSRMQSQSHRTTSSFTTASSLQAAADNFRIFAENYERGLIQCLSSVSDQEKGNSWSGSSASVSTPSSSTRQRHREVCRGGNLSIITDHDDAELHKEDEHRQDEHLNHNGDGDEPHQQQEEQKETGEPAVISSVTSFSSSPQLYRSLRLQLARVRALREQYETGVKCTEALEKLMKLNKSRDCDRQLRTHERQLVDIERQLEAMIGRFTIRVEDLEGWARICPRDYYQIEFRHGKQRKVLNLHIGKRLERLWQANVQDVCFEGKLKPNIACALKEIKSKWRLGRRKVTLGTIDIYMGEMLASISRQQSMLLNVNASGSLKIRIRCTWQPTLMEDVGDGALPKVASSSTSCLVGDQFDRDLGPICKTGSLPTGQRPPTTLSMSTSFSACRGNFGSSLASNYHLARSLMALPTVRRQIDDDDDGDGDGESRRSAVDDIDAIDVDDDLDAGAGGVHKSVGSLQFLPIQTKACLY